MGLMRMIFAFMMFIGVYGGLNFYIAHRLYKWLNLFIPYVNPKIYIGLYATDILEKLFVHDSDEYDCIVVRRK